MNPFDIQVNGYAGTDFCSPGLSVEDLHSACVALETDGFDSILATIITDSLDRLLLKVANLVHLREKDPLAQKMIAGIHVEGPFLNPAPGYIGAHDAEYVKLANVDDAKRMLDVGKGLVRLVTLAPEMDPYFETTRFLKGEGIVVSAGHCNPSLEQLKGAIDNGLSMVTHLGNGCPVELPRHDNVVQRFLHFREQLWICFIPDGHHINFYSLKNYLDLVGVERAIMVTDAISAARLGPGLHRLSGFEVEVDDEGVARRPGSANLAGSTLTMARLRRNLREQLGLSDADIQQLIDTNPRKALGLNT
ncbi:N-acetylglucosamine-6-phosphate deacetylase [Opitutia bacterium ISCC 51]|nr:N-acetylglucosamine-6-phosphate deacetylase [Opitutae bacterium ISCC 51]QXD27649.1 N-acetylglucosamine-6-phosphate deacetylase [Opitutae bacterium ISCC 52]